MRSLCACVYVFMGFHCSNLFFPIFLLVFFLIATHTVRRTCQWRHFPYSFVRWFPFTRRDGLLNALTISFLRGGRRLGRGLLPGHRRRRREQPAPNIYPPLLRTLAITPIQRKTNASSFRACILIHRRRRHPSRAQPASLSGSSPSPTFTRRTHSTSLRTD